MQKREKTLLAILIVAVVVAILVFVVVSNQSPASDETSAEVDEPVLTSAQVIDTLSSVGNVFSSDKFLMLHTFGNVPVTVDPDEVGRQNPFSPSS